MHERFTLHASASTDFSQNEMSAIAQISPGCYQIGSDTIPCAGPRHHSRLVAPVWIDSTPMTWAHYEVFVAAGGYDRSDLWCDLEHQTGTRIRPESVDNRCGALLEATSECSRSSRLFAEMSRHCPLTGITWFEAIALCRFFDARLPFEAEWEVAMQGTRNRPPNPSVGPWGAFRESKCGCRLLIGAIQEWTADAYLPRHFPGTAKVVGRVWTPSSNLSEVTVRGAASQDLYHDVSFRFGCQPSSCSSFRGCRRVWDTVPPPEKIDAIWRKRM